MATLKPTNVKSSSTGTLRKIKVVKKQTTKNMPNAQPRSGGFLKTKKEKVNKHLECLRKELRDIRFYLKADPNESTYDEVVRNVTILQKEKLSLVLQMKRISEMCAMREGENVCDAVSRTIKQLYNENELTTKDALMWEKTMMQCIGEDGPGSVTDAVERLKEQVAFARDCGSNKAFAHYDKKMAELATAAELMGKVLVHASVVINSNHEVFIEANKFIRKHKSWNR